MTPNEEIKRLANEVHELIVKRGKERERAEKAEDRVKYLENNPLKWICLSDTGAETRLNELQERIKELEVQITETHAAYEEHLTLAVTNLKRAEQAEADWKLVDDERVALEARVVELEVFIKKWVSDLAAADRMRDQALAHVVVLREALQAIRHGFPSKHSKAIDLIAAMDDQTQFIDKALSTEGQAADALLAERDRLRANGKLLFATCTGWTKKYAVLKSQLEVAVECLQHFDEWLFDMAEGGPARTALDKIKKLELAVPPGIEPGNRP